MSEFFHDIPDTGTNTLSEVELNGTVVSVELKQLFVTLTPRV